MKNYYEILGVDPEANDATLKQRFRELAMRYHPDQNTDPDAHSRFVEINEAYETLIDPQKRVLYKYRLLRWQNRRQLPPQAGEYEPAYAPTYPSAAQGQYQSSIPRQDAIHPAFRTTSRIARVFALFTLLLGLVLVVDFFWQEQIDQATVERADLILRGSTRTDWVLMVQTPPATFPMSPFLEEDLIRAGDIISMRKSAIFGIVTRVGTPAGDGTTRWFRPHVGIYGPPFAIVLVMIGVSIATWRDPKNIMHNTLLGILLVFLLMIISVILNKS